MHRLIRVYATVSRFAERPHRFSAEFRDEMRSVSADATAEAAARGKVALWVLLWRELRDVPRHALCEQWRSIAARRCCSSPGPRGEGAGVTCPCGRRSTRDFKIRASW